MSSSIKLNFDNLALRALPLDSSMENCPRQVKKACFALLPTTLQRVEGAKLVAYSADALKLVGLSEQKLLGNDQVVAALSGNELFDGSTPAAHCYAGHQFGYFAGQLGDGAVMYLGEVVNEDGERWEIQLKGSGKTPFSRTADGRKVLRSTIREFLCSEAMHYLGIETSRAATCITSDSLVVRDKFYNGDILHERCSIVSRIARSFIRFGSFEICKTLDKESMRSGPSAGDTSVILDLAKYCTSNLFKPEVDSKLELSEQIFQMYGIVVERTAVLIAKWQAVGFCHGVLNTDNMSIVGITIDYGPFGFMDRYDPKYVCNASDDGGRYDYESQVEIGLWNLGKLAESLSLLFPIPNSSCQLKQSEALEQMKTLLNETYMKCYNSEYWKLMRRKFGLLFEPNDENLPLESETDKNLVNEFFDTMEETGADFTCAFRRLFLIGEGRSIDVETLIKALVASCASVESLKSAYKPQVSEEQLEFYTMLQQMQTQMSVSNSKKTSALDRELERHRKTKELRDMSNGRKRDNDTRLWRKWCEKYAERIRECPKSLGEKRKQIQLNSNPRYILRNHIAQIVITKAEEGDFSYVQNLLNLLKAPFSHENESFEVHVGEEEEEDSVNVTYDRLPPNWASELKVT